MLTPSSIFTNSGVDVDNGRRNITYLYGLSDFFTFIFEDSDKVSTIVETQAISASDIYSRFLQKTSSLSLGQVQTNTGVTLKLILVKNSDQIGVLPEYLISEGIAASKYLSNRPFLPTSTLEENVDFKFEQQSPTSTKLRLARPIEEYKFSRRVLSDGSEEFAIWVVDAVMDEQLTYKAFGQLLGIKAEVSSEQFSNFIYGLYFIYLNGPTLRVLQQGLNLVLGIPLARETETVIDVRTYLETDQYLVLTENNQYLLPNGITPAVSVGDTLDQGDAVATWVELKDYISDGSWWLDVTIPETVIRSLPPGQPDRFAREGSPYSRIMTDYLYRNTFLIQINTDSFTDNQYFSQVSDILMNVKPAYAQPIYVWKTTFDNDDFSIDESSLSSTQVPGQITSINCLPIDVITMG